MDARFFLPDSTSARDDLYAELGPLVRRLLRQYGQDPQLRHDLPGEIFCRFCALLDAFDPTRGIPLRPYLLRQLQAATYTYARKQWRRQRREVALEGADPPAGVIPDPTRQWDEALAVAQVRSALPGAIEGLPARQRQVLLWRYYQGRSFEEIAQLLAIQPATARSLLRHALNNLRCHLRVHQACG
jgi:RNA polymerase sigma factor (sigma-70 family)